MTCIHRRFKLENGAIVQLWISNKNPDAVLHTYATLESYLVKAIHEAGHAVRHHEVCINRSLIEDKESA